MIIDPNKILQALSMIPDPVSGQDLVKMKMVQDLKVEGNNVNFTLVLSSLNIEQKSELNFECIGIIQKLYPQAEVNIHMMARNQAAPQAVSALPQVKKHYCCCFRQRWCRKIHRL